MPSKHTVVVSLDSETERIVNNLGGNRSEWIRDAIKWRHGPGADLETMEALAEARKRQLNVVERHVRQLVWCLTEYEKKMVCAITDDAIKACQDWLELR